MDALSKADTTMALSLMRGSPSPGYVSRTLTSFMKTPVPERCLGKAITVELASWMKVLDSQVEWKDSYIHLVKYPEKETCKIQDICLAISVYIYCSMLGKRRVVLGMMGAPGKMNSNWGFTWGFWG